MQEGPLHIPFLFSPLQFMYLFNVKHPSYPDSVTVPTFYTYSLIWHFNTKTLASPSCCSAYISAYLDMCA